MYYYIKQSEKDTAISEITSLPENLDESSGYLQIKNPDTLKELTEDDSLKIYYFDSETNYIYCEYLPREKTVEEKIQENSDSIDETMEALCELGDLSDESLTTNEDLIDAVTELGDLVAEQAETITALQEMIEQLLSE